MTYILYTLFIFPITQIIELIFTFSSKIFKDTAVSILTISVIISVICLPLYNAAERWQIIERDLIKRLKPKIDRIKSVFSGDERFMILQTFYRQNNYHPVYALRSTFGILLQVPFFIAAYSFISHMEAIKGASFFFINNLGEPDRLISINDSITINILPIIMTVINLLSGALYSKDFPLKDKIQLYGISAVFLILLYNSPSALVIYWTANNIFSLLKNIYYKIEHKNKKTILAVIVCVSLIYIAIHLMFFYNGNWFLRILISAVSLFSVFIYWTIFFINKLKLNKKINNIFIKLPNNTFFIFLFSFSALFIITGLYLPSNLIVSSPQEFSFIEGYTTPLFFIGNTFLQSFSFFILWPLLLYFLLKKYQKQFSLLASILLFCSIVNIFFFPGNYGLISVEMVYDGNVYHTFKESIINILILFIPILLVFFLYSIKKEKILCTIIMLCIVSTIFISFINILTINKEYKNMSRLKNNDSWTITEIKPVFELSKNGKNTVIIILDRAVSLFIPYIFQEDQTLFNKYSGFVYYPNTVSFYHYTVLGMPPIHGGYEYTPFEMNKRNDKSIANKHYESFLLMPTIFSQLNYKITVLDPPYFNYSMKDDLQIYNDLQNTSVSITDSRYTKIWLDQHDLTFASTADILKRNLFWNSLFKLSPLALRYGIYLQGDYCASTLMNKMLLTINGYAILDYLPVLTSITQGDENTFLIMVNNTTHEPSFLQAPEYRPANVVTNFGDSPFNKETAYHVNAASIKRIGEWIEFLKANNVYDNTRIILVSDHGASPVFKYKTNLPFNIEWYNALLMVKDFEDSGTLRTDDTFMSNADVPIIALNGLIENPVNPFTGKEITSSLKSNPLYIAISGSFNLSDPSDSQIHLDPKIDHYVHTNIFNPDNWKRIEP